MRFLIGCHEICGLIRTYSDELKKQGHSVITISDKNPFFDYSYDYSLTNFRYDYFNKNISNKYLKKIFFKISEITENTFPKFRLYIALLSIVCKIDAYIYIWNGFIPDKNLFWILKFFKIKIVVLFLGDEVRNFTAFKQEYDISFWQFPDTYTNKSIEESIMKLRYAEKYANIIYSVPDQMGFATRPYFHLHIPIHLSDYKFKNNKRKVPLVLHLPSEPFIKGSDVIMKVLEELKNEGVEFELIYQSKIPHHEVKKILSNVDILIDELILHGPGVLSLEAMASGCAVATNHLEQHEGLFNPPVCIITHETIKQKVKELIVNYEYRQDLIIKGYKYVTDNCNPSKIVADILLTLSSEKKSKSYQPRFYKEQFIKPTQYEAVFDKADKLYFN